MKGPRIWGTLDPFLEAGPVYGRRVANSRFLHFLLRAEAFDQYHFYLASSSDCELQKEHLRNAHPKLYERGLFKVLHRLELPRGLASFDYHCFHLSDCINHPARLARVRNRCSRQAFPITSTTHSLSMSGYGEAFLRHLWPGTTARDCIVATSNPGAEVVRRYFAWLREGYGLDPDIWRQPRIEHIPLGVDLKCYEPPDPVRRAAVRSELGIGAERIVILALGRLQHWVDRCFYRERYDHLQALEALRG